MGAVLDGHLLGSMQFGPPIDRRKLLPLVSGTPWNGFVELNRMAFSDLLPRNSESRCLAVAARLLRRDCPHVQWIISFADGTRCGDGAIYRAAGFLLTGIKKNTAMWVTPAGFTFSDIGYRNGSVVRATIKQEVGVSPISRNGMNTAALLAAGCRRFEGFQLRYILPLHDDVRRRLTVPVLDYSELDAVGAKMYRGKAVSMSRDVANSNLRAGSADSGTPGIQPGRDGATPIPALQTHHDHGQAQGETGPQDPADA